MSPSYKEGSQHSVDDGVLADPLVLRFKLLALLWVPGVLAQDYEQVHAFLVRSPPAAQYFLFALQFILAVALNFIRLRD